MQRVAIVGAGPAGFYTAQHLLKNPKIKIDLFEQLPTPYGLVRFGVSPLHPEVKNVQHKFQSIGEHPNLEFYGNVQVGKDVTLDQLRSRYNAVVLAYGSHDDRHLDRGEAGIQNIFTSKSFVGWYNGHPQHQNIHPNVETETAVV